MKLTLSMIIFLGVIAFGAIGWNTIKATDAALHDTQSFQATVESDNLKSADEIATDGTEIENPAAARYRLDAGQSRFMVGAQSTGLLWFLGHDHHIAAREFAGEVQLAGPSLEPASLRITIKTQSLVETGERFTDQEKQIINNSMHKEVLETAKYPEAIFKSANVTAKKTGENQYQVDIEGDLTLHGMTRRITIPAQVTVEADSLRAIGKFEFDRDDFNIKTKSVKGGTVRVDDDMKLSFNIVAHKY